MSSRLFLDVYQQWCLGDLNLDGIFIRERSARGPERLRLLGPREPDDEDVRGVSPEEGARSVPVDPLQRFSATPRGPGCAAGGRGGVNPVVWSLRDGRELGLRPLPRAEGFRGMRSADGRGFRATTSCGPSVSGPLEPRAAGVCYVRRKASLRQAGGCPTGCGLCRSAPTARRRLRGRRAQVLTLCAEGWADGVFTAYGSGPAD